MAWTCAACRIEIALDTHGCPGCGAMKESWTVVADVTRALVIDVQRWEVWRGKGDHALRADNPRARPGGRMPLLPAEEAVALPKAEAARLAAQGLAPAPRDQLVLRVFPKSDAAPTAVVTVLYAKQPPLELPLTTTAPALTQGRFDLHYVFVFGEGQAPAFPGLQVVDLTDPDAPDGHAPHVEVTGLRKVKRPRELPVRARATPPDDFVFSR